MQQDDIRAIIQQGNTALGIELGSTRIKAVLVGSMGYFGHDARLFSL